MIEHGLFDHVVSAFCISTGKRVMARVQRSLEELSVSRSLKLERLFLTLTTLSGRKIAGKALSSVKWRIETRGWLPGLSWEQVSLYPKPRSMPCLPAGKGFGRDRESSQQDGL